MIKRLSACIGQYRRDTILAPVFVTLEVIMEVLVPLLMASLIDKGVDAGDMPYILKMGLILVGCCLLSLAFGILSGRSAAIASSGFGKNLRHDLYHHVQDFSFTNIDKFSSASLVTRMTTDVTNIQNAFQMLIRIAVRCPTMLLFALIMAFQVNASLAPMFLIILPVLGGGLALMMTKVHPVFKRVFRTYDKLNSVVQENLRGIRVVKSFVREDHEIDKFDQVSSQIYTDFKKAETIISFNAPLMNFCVYFCMLMLSWLGARLIITTHGSSMTTGQLMSMISYVMQILMSLMMVSMVFMMIIMARTSAERVLEVLDEEPTIENPPRPVTEIPDGSIDFEDVVFSYSGRAEYPVLDHVSLHINSGETIGILGSTGSSKSSLVQLIPRLYDVNQGAVKVGGQDVRSYDIETLRNEVAMVLQKNVLFSGTIRENLRWGNEAATDEEMVHACRLAQADEFIRQFPDGYNTYIEQGGANVSGGQRQRLCIARALLKKPKILILDDSTSAVDTRTDALIRQAFAQEIPGTTKLIIAQRISSVQDADRILVLDNGKISDFGTHQELLSSSEIYREVYDSQTRKEER